MILYDFMTQSMTEIAPSNAGSRSDLPSIYNIYTKNRKKRLVYFIKAIKIMTGENLHSWISIDLTVCTSIEWLSKENKDRVSVYKIKPQIYDHVSICKCILYKVTLKLSIWLAIMVRKSRKILYCYDIITYDVKDCKKSINKSTIIESYYMVIYKFFIKGFVNLILFN